MRPTAGIRSSHIGFYTSDIAYVFNTGAGTHVDEGCVFMGLIVSELKIVKNRNVINTEELTDTTNNQASNGAIVSFK